MKDFSSEIREVLEHVSSAGQIALSHWKGTEDSKPFTIEDKEDGSQVTSVDVAINDFLIEKISACLLYTSPSPRDATLSRMPSSA